VQGFRALHEIAEELKGGNGAYRGAVAVLNIDKRWDRNSPPPAHFAKLGHRSWREQDHLLLADTHRTS